MARILPLLLLFALAGCESFINDLVHQAAGESSRERADRHQMEGMREAWSTPGRWQSEVDAEARGSFRRQNGRDPNLNWSAR